MLNGKTPKDGLDGSDRNLPHRLATHPDVEPIGAVTDQSARDDANEFGSSERDARDFSSGASTEDAEPKILSIAELEKQAILSTIRQLKGDKLMAAKLLGIGKTTLYRKLKEYGLSDDGGLA